MKRWIFLFCLSAALCVTLAAAAVPTPLNCHEMAALMFGEQDSAQLLGAGDETEAALSDYFTAREAAYRGDALLLAAEEESMSAAVADNNALRAERVREMETRLDMSVLDADVTTRIERDRTVRNPDGTLTLYVYEWTFYDYDDLSDGEGGMDVSGFGTWHILTVAERPDGSCQILSDEYDESDILGISTLSEERVQEMMERGFAAVDFGAAPDDTPLPDDDDASLLAISYYQDYDVDAAVAYSEKYWENYNPAYANFNSVGGDCANFTSQSIYAGGMPQVVTKPYASDGWYYKTSTDRSATWASATSLHHWMRDNRGRCVTASKTTVYTGSPVFYSKTGYSSQTTRDSKKENIAFAHAVLCVGTNSAGTPIINSHNTDRYHVMWNYYTGTVDFDTVQLTSATFGSFKSYMKLDADFYAYIINPSLNRYVTNDGEGKVTSRAKTEQAGQVWHFTLQSDGSYQIVSALRDATQKTPALAAAGGEWASRTAICTENDAAGPGQRWYLYLDSNTFSWGTGAYQLRPKCSDRVMDIVEGSANEGANLWLWSKQSSLTDREAQLFQIYQTTWVELETPSLDVKLEGSEGANVTFSWTAINGAASYNLRVTQDGKEVRAVTLRRADSYGMKLEPGNYEATVQAVSANERTSSISDAVPFTVLTSYTITFYPNGGEGDPTEQMKIQQLDAELSKEIPVYKGYDFDSWNTQANGTGETYQPGAVYDKDENLALYAQWKPAQFTVTLKANSGRQNSPADVEYVVTYKEPYGELPTPQREGEFEFAGWYTEADEGQGELITAETTVTVPEDHILYAHWDDTAVYILPSVRKSGSLHRITTALHLVPEGVLFACGYLNGEFVAATSGNIQQNQSELALDLDGEFDKILVIALERNSMRPLCKSEAWPSS